MEGLLLLLLSAVGTGGGTWTVAADEEGVRVEQLEGAETPLQEFRAEGVVGASPEACLAAVRADEFFARTAPNVAEARVVASEGESVRWFYARLDPPFIAARDYTLRVEVAAAPSPGGPELQLLWRVENARGPGPRPGTVRVERSDGAWRFLPVDGGRRTLARYELATDPGGSIPRWLARRAQIAGILAAFEELRRTAAQRNP
jgi:hypothetical protein